MTKKFNKNGLSFSYSNGLLVFEIPQTNIYYEYEIESWEDIVRMLLKDECPLNKSMYWLRSLSDSLEFILPETFSAFDMAFVGKLDKI